MVAPDRRRRERAEDVAAAHHRLHVGVRVRPRQRDVDVIVVPALRLALEARDHRLGLRSAVDRVDHDAAAAVIVERVRHVMLAGAAPELEGAPLRRALPPHREPRVTSDVVDGRRHQSARDEDRSLTIVRWHRDRSLPDDATAAREREGEDGGMRSDAGHGHVVPQTARCSPVARSSSPPGRRWSPSWRAVRRKSLPTLGTSRGEGRARRAPTPRSWVRRRR